MGGHVTYLSQDSQCRSDVDKDLAMCCTVHTIQAYGNEFQKPISEWELRVRDYSAVTK